MDRVILSERLEQAERQHRVFQPSPSEPLDFEAIIEAALPHESRCYMRDPDGYLIEVGQPSQLAIDAFKNFPG